MYNFYFFYYNYYGDNMFKYKRVVAFIIDTLLISILTILLTNSIANPNRDVQKAYSDAYEAKMSSIKIEDVPTSDSSKVVEYYKEHIGVELYDYIKSNAYAYLYFIILNVLYFVLFAYFNNGRTLGCLISKLQIVDRNNNKANLLSLSIRSLFMGANSIYMFPLQAILYLIIPRITDYSNGFIYLMSLTGIIVIVEIVLFIFFLFNKKNMGLHDYLSNTKIIDMKK